MTRKTKTEARQERRMPEVTHEQRMAQLRADRDRATRILCAWGNCTDEVLDGKVTGGWGQIACPCDHVPGWSAVHPAGRAKPSMPVKAVGRHGSRVQRARRRKSTITFHNGRQIWAPILTWSNA
ncbi:hypothetical protein [Leifsonia sp. Leaf264]|uniref:hypothetical protein n=1 Tax=Leifsonia sp. Leaf264 TaxID=1736314 RepID=UPI0006F940AE|nr:hypothetical protein [Leifsonia sp. Leaf264]KQO98386.1 hypothetical protein ASF30_10015 [Leifsonia sp. Leaf264]